MNAGLHGPGSAGSEIEFKFRVSGEGAFRQLARALGEDYESLSASLQINHFFDSEGADLRGKGLALRLREESGCFSLTAKGPASVNPVAADATLSARPELEAEIGAEQAREILEGRACALELLSSATCADAPLLSEMRGALSGRALAYVGCFRNRRTRLGPLAPPGMRQTPPLTFELDCTEFPAGRVDYEIEVELERQDQVGPAQECLRQLLAQAGIEPHSASSKAARFFALRAAETDEGSGGQTAS